jgi:hypothetical protein
LLPGETTPRQRDGFRHYGSAAPWETNIALDCAIAATFHWIDHDDLEKFHFEDTTEKSSMTPNSPKSSSIVRYPGMDESVSIEAFSWTFFLRMMPLVSSNACHSSEKEWIEGGVGCNVLKEIFQRAMLDDLPCLPFVFAEPYNLPVALKNQILETMMQSSKNP